MNQIDELMYLARLYALQTKYDYENQLNGKPTDSAESHAQRLRSALEAALKPGEPIAFYDGKKFYGSLEAASMCMADAKKIVPVYTAAPPAQPDVRPGEPVGYVASQITWKSERYHSEQLVKVTQHPQPEYGFVHAVYTAAPPAQPDVKPGEPVITGAIYDFAAFLTTRPAVIKVGSTAHAGPMAELVEEWCQLRNLSSREEMVRNWQNSVTAPPAQTPTLEINFGERYAGLVLDAATGAPSHHLVLLPGEEKGMNWDDASKWAKEQGGDLPTRQEQSLLFANLKSEFQPEWYWSGEKASEVSAWYQVFRYGFAHNDTYLACEVRVRAVRRISAAPPAQTPVPPRLTDDELENIRVQCADRFAEACRSGLKETKTVARAVESAVRKQFLGDRDE